MPCDLHGGTVHVTTLQVVYHKNYLIDFWKEIGQKNAIGTLFFAPENTANRL
jgi:hypothetical protein